MQRVDLFGLPFVDAATIDEVAHLILVDADRGEHRHPVVVTPNTDLLVQLLETDDAETREFVADSWCVLPDGQPIVWASRYLGTPLRARLTGSDLFARLWPELAAAARSVVVLAASDAIRDGLLAEHPRARVLVAPDIDVSDRSEVRAAAHRCAEEVAASNARIVVLGLGHPKDLSIARELLSFLGVVSVDPSPTVLCLGASAELHLGLRRRAPRWVQRMGLEWLFRFVQEPRRLFHRYFIRDVAFLRIVRDAKRSS
jgi:N-acetylglucosaminyldiphosphoundecaprenol N-acetyl-beta-D-mannosaminyltransferase